MKIVRLSILSVLFLAAIACSNTANTISRERNDLWNIVSHCIDSSRSLHCEDCPLPIEGSACACLKTTEVWEKSDDYVAIRDRKMCGCPGGFVHGLALPRKQITGAEDKDRPVGIWRFAWQVAAKRIEEPEVALLVNGKTCRSQDQLHVHIVKLNSEGHNFMGKNAAKVADLAEVWSTAEELANKAQIKYFSVLVRLGDRGFVVVVDDGCLEERYTEYACEINFAPVLN